MSAKLNVTTKLRQTVRLMGYASSNLAAPSVRGSERIQKFVEFLNWSISNGGQTRDRRVNRF
jgi:hypothetical protein